MTSVPHVLSVHILNINMATLKRVQIIRLFSPWCLETPAGSKTSVFSPHKLAKNLTPTLFRTRKRFETISAGSTTDTEGGISPMWESEEVSDGEIAAAVAPILLAAEINRTFF